VNIYLYISIAFVSIVMPVDFKEMFVCVSFIIFVMRTLKDEFCKRQFLKGLYLFLYVLLIIIIFNFY